MSTDYYYVCPAIKAYMPAFTFNMSGMWHAHEDGLTRWLRKTHGQEVLLIVEQSPLWNVIHEQDWEYVSPYEKEPEK